MYKPSMSLLRSEVSPDIDGVTVVSVKRSSTPAASYKLRITSANERVPRSLIVKRIDDGWPDDPLGHEREVRFYKWLLPKLNIAHPLVYFAGREPGCAHALVIMEDVSDDYRFPPPTHIWNQSEIELILQTYAHLHEYGQIAIVEEERDWMVDRHEKRLYDTVEELPHMVETLVSRNIWPEITGFGRLLERTLHEAHQLSTQPVTVLHNDVYPPNCGIPVNMSGETILLDWEMVGWGLEELDLAFMFLQPYGSHLELDRAEALSYYWRARQRLGCPVRSSAEHQLRQRYADALWALWLIPVAYHMAMSPYPIGSSPRIYWNAMFKVLGARLQSLSSAA